MPGNFTEDYKKIPSVNLYNFCKKLWIGYFENFDNFSINVHQYSIIASHVVPLLFFLGTSYGHWPFGWPSVAQATDGALTPSNVSILCSRRRHNHPMVVETWATVNYVSLILFRFHILKSCIRFDLLHSSSLFFVYLKWKKGNISICII